MVFLLTAALFGLANPAVSSPARPSDRAAADPVAAATGAPVPVLEPTRSSARIPMPGLVFEPNRGQTDAAVQFLARATGYLAFLTPGQTVLVVAPPADQNGARSAPGHRSAARSRRPPSVVTMELVGGNPGAPAEVVDRLPGVVNYYRGSDPAQWRTGIPTYARVLYRAVYPGIDVVYRGDGGRLAHDFVVAPGADPSVIQLAFAGADSLALDGGGDLIVRTAGGELRLARPVSYQDVRGRRVSVESRFSIASTTRRVARLHVGAYDPRRPLVIDPTYYVTFGGCCHDTGSAVAVDGAGNAYITGSTASPDFPATTQSFRGAEDAFVTAVGPDGTPLFSTFLGGAGADAGNGLMIAGAGLVVVGATTSRDFPGADPGQRGQSVDAFVAHLDLAGRLLSARYLGGSGEDWANAVVGCGGHLCVVGTTTSPDFPGARPGSHGGQADAFVARLDLTGQVIAARYLGGSGHDTGTAIAAAADGRIFVVGSTASDDLPGADPSTRGGGVDAFVAELDAGLALTRARYLGGAASDLATGIVTSAEGNPLFVVGSTDSGDFPGVAASTRGGGTDAFVAVLDARDFGMLAARYLGGAGEDHGEGIALLPPNRLWVTGSTASADFPTQAPRSAAGSDFDRAYRTGLGGASDAFLTALTGLTLDLAFSTYLGTDGDEFGRGVAVAPSGTVHVVGTVVAESTGVFLAQIPPPPPELTGLHPASAPALGALRRDLKIMGSGLAVAERVAVGDTLACAPAGPASPCGISDSTITVPVPAGSVGPAATVAVSIQDRSGLVVGRLPFRILSMTPSVAPVGGKDELVVTISAGATPAADLPPAFDARSVVRWNGEAVPTTVADDGNALTARISSDRLAHPGEAQVVVTMVLQRGAPLIDSEPMLFGIGLERPPGDASTTVGCSGTSITPGTPVNGSLTEADCPSVGRPGAKGDFYTFTGTAGQVVTITMSAAASFVDTFVLLYGPSGTMIAQNDDCPSTFGLDSCITNFTLPSSGTYTIEASSFLTTARGAYSLLLIASPVLLVTPAAVDFGSVTVGGVADQAFTITNGGSSALSGNATVGGPFSVIGGASYNLGGGLSQTVSVRFAPTGTGFVSSTVNFSTSGGAPVARTVSGTGVTCVSTPITPGGTVNGTLSDSDCTSIFRTGTKADRYTFNGTAGQQATINMSAPASFVDTFVFLIGPTGTVVASNDDCPTSGGLNSCITNFTLPSTGTYTIEATAFIATSRGAYTLSLALTGGLVLTVTPASVDFGSVTVGGIADQSFTLTNSGGGTITGTATVAPPFSVVAGGSYNLGAGATQIVTVRFSPTANGFTSGTVNFGVTGGSPVTRTVSGTGVTCALTPIFPGTTVNGNLSDSDCTSIQRPGAKADRYTFNGTAGQQATINMSAPASFVDTVVYLLGPTGTVVASNDDCLSPAGLNSCIVNFPLPSTGTYTIEATSFIATSRGAYTLLLALTGGLALSVTPASVDFGLVTVNAIADQSFTLTNGGGGTITGTATVAAPFSVVAGGSYTLGPGATQTVTVRFSPTAAGFVSGTVSFGVTGGSPVTRTVSGTGATCGTTPITPGTTVNGNLADSDCTSINRPGAKADRYTFSGTVGQQITITMSAPSSFVDTFLFLIGPTGTVLTQNDDCPSPSGLNSCINGFTLPTTGTFTIEATSFLNTSRGAYTLTLSPFGGPVLSVSPGSLNFGSVTVGGVLDQSFTLTNVGTSALSGSAATAPPFSIPFGGSYSLAVGASQTVTVRFSPTLVGSPAGTVTFGVIGGAAVARTVSGIGVGCGTIPIALGATVNGSLADSDCSSIFRPGARADRYTFAGTAGQQINITMSAPASFLDTYLFLAAPAGNLLAQSDDCGFDLSSCINSFTLPTTGTYTIEATSFSALARGAYTLTVSPSISLVVSPASQDFGTVTVGGVADRSFTVTNSSPGVLNGSAGVPPPFSVVAGANYSLGPGASQPVTVRFSPTAAISASANVSFGVTGGSPVTRSVSGFGVTCGLAPISPGIPVSGNLAESDCSSLFRPGAKADRFTFSGTAGQRVTITMETPPSSFIDTFLFLVAPNGSLAAQNDDCGDLHSCINSFELPVTGVYTIEATSFSTIARGAYALLLTISSGTALTVTPASQDFGAVTVGGSAERTFTVTNGGSGVLSGSATTAPPYGIVSGGTYNLGPGASQTVAVRFNPGGTGGAPGSVSFSAAGLSSVSRQVSGSGVSCSPTPITPGTPVNGELAETDCTSVNRPGSKADRFTFSGGVGERVTITMSAPFPSFDDTYVFLLGPGDTVVAANDDCPSPRGFNSCITSFPLPVGGTYTIEASSFFATARGPYTLRVDKTSVADLPPVVSGVTATGITSNSAIVTWQTNEPATGQVQFGETCCPLQSTRVTTLTLAHAIALDGLLPATTYSFRAVSIDAGGNPTASDVLTLRTLADTVGPAITGIVVAGLTTRSAVVNWATSEPATGQIEVGTSGPCPCPSRSVRTPGLTLPHSIAVAGLEPNTRYFFRVLSADAAGNLTATQGGTFTTPDLKVTVGEISGNVESRDSLGRLLSLSRGVTLPAGALIQTKSSSEAKDVTAPDGGRFQLASETRATIGPPGNSPGGQFSAQLVDGAVTFQSQALTARTERVRTDNVTIHSGDGECAGTASSSRDGNTVTTVVDVQTGQCEVRDKQGRIDQVSEGERRTYEDLVPKVSLLLPAHLDHMKRTSIGRARTKNPVVWTTLAGASGYVIEWAVLPTQGFTTPNARAIERPANTLWLLRGPGGMTVRLGESPATAVLGPQLEEIISYSESNGNAQMDVALDAPSGVQLVWRVFPLDPSGALLPNTDASDARIFTIEDELDNR